MKQSLSRFWDFYRGRGCIGKGVIIGAVLTLLLFLCAGFGSLLPSPPETPTPLPSATLEPIATQVPTQTAVPPPTVAPPPTIVPTYTPYPTYTPFPSPTLLAATPEPPTLTPPAASDMAEAQYVVQLLSIQQSYQDSMYELVELTSAATQDTSLMIDDEWRTKNAVVFATWRLNGERLRGLESPEAYRSAHDHFVAASHHFDAAADYFAEGIDKFDADSITLGIAEMQAAQEDMLKSSDALEALVE